MTNETDYLLILACSNRKIQSDMPLPAFQRYDGGAYKVIRKMQRENKFPTQVDIKIISAEFGLIDSETPIPFYNRKMNLLRAKELKNQVQTRLNNIILVKNYREIYIDLGKIYLTTLEDFSKPLGINFLVTKGRIGERLANLKNWLLSLNKTR